MILKCYGKILDIRVEQIGLKDHKYFLKFGANFEICSMLEETKIYELESQDDSSV